MANAKAKTKKQIYEEFKKRYVRNGIVGVIVGGDWEPVVLGSLCLASDVAESHRERYGCLTTEAILVDWYPPDTIDTPPVPQSDWKLFPKHFRGLRIYYNRGHIATTGKP